MYSQIEDRNIFKSRLQPDLNGKPFFAEAKTLAKTLAKKIDSIILFILCELSKLIPRFGSGRRKYLPK